jgi:cell division protein FtsW
MGLIGSLIVIVLYLIIGFTGLSTALNAPDTFGRLLAVGTTTWIMIQAFVNIGAVLGLLPITGITLPFLSFGGNALLSTLIAYGILLNVARQSK